MLILLGGVQYATEFQYLKGAIGSMSDPTEALQKSKFQYLKGAIGRVPKWKRPDISKVGFNTSKVRLGAPVVAASKRR